jgi:acyl dehydratase
MYKEYIGKRSTSVTNIVERGAVRNFANALGDSHPIYTDEEFASQTIYKNNIAPPTFPRVFTYGVIDGLKLPPSGLIHGEQVFTYKRPLVVGEKVNCYIRIEDYYEKKANSGTLSFLVTMSVGEDSTGEKVFTCKSVVIITEAVKKGMRET